MDPINIFCGIVLIVSLVSNLTGAKKGFKTSISQNKEKPKTYLQKYPVNLSAIILIIVVLGVFKIGTIEIAADYYFYRIAGLIFFALGSFLQIYSYKSLKNNYSQDVVILKDQKLVTLGIYKYVRHPQYFWQLISDLGVSIALVSFIALPLVILLEIPLFYLRGKLEDKLLEKHFGEKFRNYKKRTGFFVPFIG
ncbi:MAG: isoprenylcysteine carboxylmethyltransferase family protein [bacterium]